MDRQAAIAIIRAFDESRATVFGEAQARAFPSPKDLTTASRWLAAGATLDLCRFVFDAQNAKIKSQQREPMNALSAFDRDISDAIANGKRPMPPARPPRPTGNGPRQPELSVAEKQRYREKWGLTQGGWTAELQQRIRENNLQDRWHKGA